MPICSTQNLRQDSASSTYNTTYPTFMSDSPKLAPCTRLTRSNPSIATATSNLHAATHPSRYPRDHDDFCDRDRFAQR